MDKNRIIKFAVIFAIFAVIGILIIVFNKFEFNVNYSKNVRIELDLGKTFDAGEITEITNEIYKNQLAVIRSTGNFGETISITVKDSTDEQNEELINRINEKYETDFSVADLKLYYNSNVKGIDLITPYIVPSIVAGVLILVFFGIRYRKLGILTIFASVLAIVIGTAILYMALSSIFKMEINEISIAGGFAIAIFSLTYIATVFEKRLEEK